MPATLEAWPYITGIPLLASLGGPVAFPITPVRSAQPLHQSTRRTMARRPFLTSLVAMDGEFMPAGSKGKELMKPDCAGARRERETDRLSEIAGCSDRIQFRHGYAARITGCCLPLTQTPGCRVGTSPLRKRLRTSALQRS